MAQQENLILATLPQENPILLYHRLSQSQEVILPTVVYFAELIVESQAQHRPDRLSKRGPNRFGPIGEAEYVNRYAD